MTLQTGKQDKSLHLLLYNELTEHSSIFAVFASAPT